MFKSVKTQGSISINYFTMQMFQRQQLLILQRWKAEQAWEALTHAFWKSWQHKSRYSRYSYDSKDPQQAKSIVVLIPKNVLSEKQQ